MTAMDHLLFSCRSCVKNAGQSLNIGPRQGYKKPVKRTRCREQHCWETRSFDPITSSLAQYFKAGRSWVFVQAFAGSCDGRRALVHGSLVRRYMDHCGSWTSSYRMALSLVQEMRITPSFPDHVLVVDGFGDVEAVRAEARWDVFFDQLSGVQEYGWHAGLEALMWASDAVNGGLSELVQVPRNS